VNIEVSALQAQCVSAILTTVAFGTALNGAEILSMRKECGKQGLLSWRVGRSLYPFALKKGIAVVLDAFCDYPQYIWVVGAQMLCALALLLNIFPNGKPIFLLTLLVVHLLSMLRYPQGTDGTDQMQTILLAALACYYLTPDPFVRKSAVWFISLQAILAYFTAGVAKVFSRAWREGTVLKMSLMLAPGNRTIYQWLPKGDRINQFLCWAVILFECTFPLALVGPKICLVFLGCGVLLHLFNAFALSLPKFLFTLVATYPAVFASTQDLQSILQ